MVPKILIVEDDESLRRVMHIQLSREGYETTSVADSEQALQTIGKAPQNLVITDLNLPGMSGMDLLRKVRGEYPETAVVVMTAFGTIPSAVEAIKSGAYDYITKPIHPYEMKALVSRVLEHYRLLEEVQVLRTCLDRKYGFEQIIGSSEILVQALDVAGSRADSFSGSGRQLSVCAAGKKAENKSDRGERRTQVVAHHGDELFFQTLHLFALRDVVHDAKVCFFLG